MNESAKTLSLVFNEAKDAPLIAECTWKDAPGREPPDMPEFLRSRAKLPALCILFLLMKHRELKIANAQTPAKFQVKIRKGTWICTIASKFPNFKEWVKSSLHIIREDELFLDACAGSTHKKEGKKYPHVEFLPSKVKLDLSLKPQISTQPKRPFRDEEYLSFALGIEKEHWNPENSAVKAWHFSEFDEPVCSENSAAVWSGDDKLVNFFHLKFPIGRAQMVESAGAYNLMAQFNLSFRLSMDKEIDGYYQNCQSFFNFTRNHLNASRAFHLWDGPDTNLRQVEFLRNNCLYYAHFCCLAIQKLIKSGGHFDDDKFTSAIWGEIDDKDKVESFVVYIFSCLSAELELIGFSYNKIDGLPFVLEEAKESIRVLSWGLDNINCAVAYGVFFTQQVILIDFLSYVCSPFHHLILSPDGNSECFHLIIPMLRKEAPRCKDFIHRFCKEPKDFRDCANAGKLLLRAQSNFWNSLHRRLIELDY